MLKKANKGSVRELVAVKKKLGAKARKITPKIGYFKSSFLDIFHTKKQEANDTKILKIQDPIIPNCAKGELSIVKIGFPQ